jgi:hypothetical protein
MKARGTLTLLRVGSMDEAEAPKWRNDEVTEAETLLHSLSYLHGKGIQIFHLLKALVRDSKGRLVGCWCGGVSWNMKIIFFEHTENLFCQSVLDLWMETETID